MCGIAGFFNYKSRIPPNIQNLRNILESFRYRGPDHLGVFKDNELAMGNVRLAIRDIHETGNQPIYNEDKSVVVVYNGEIYNSPELRTILEGKGHRFYTGTDTEVLVHLYEEYGDALANDLNGMFAFAIFDIKKRLLLLGRDRTAQKPLYINKNGRGIFFSSELKAMLPYLDSRTLNPSAIRTFLELGYSLEPQTILREVEIVEPGSIYTFSHTNEIIKRFWTLGSNKTEVITDLSDWKQQADIALKKAVKRHLISDVPITLFLSGGIDSSLLSVYLREENRIKKAFTGSFTDCKDHDEYDFALDLGKYCGYEVERIQLSNKCLSSNLDEFLSRASMPQGDYSGLATYCLAMETSKEFKVVIGGDGGDELFGGYPTYTLPHLSRMLSFVPKKGIEVAHALASKLFSRQKYMPLPFKLQQIALAWGQDIPTAHFQIKNFLPQNVATSILNRDFFAPAISTSTTFENYYKENIFTDPVHKLCWVDFNTFLRSGTIPKVERNTMLSSLEARLPYLDNDIVNLGINTSSSLLVNRLETKKCLRSLLNDKLNNRVKLNPRKQGFSPPLVSMLNNDLREWKEHCLNIKTPFYDGNLSKTLSEWENKGWDLHRLYWNICVLNDWCSRNKLI